MKFDLIRNDGEMASWRQLLECKCLLARQLPKMPKEYLVRLIFDPNHYTITLRDDELLGACCFRPFPDDTGHSKGVLEVAFLAVSSVHQVRGLGTSLMNALKALAVEAGFSSLLTYADVAAVGYFAKQGFFSAEKNLLPSAWMGHFKDYDGAHLMQCKLLNSVNYWEIPKALQEKRMEIIKKVIARNKFSVFPGLDARPDRISDIPGVDRKAEAAKSLEAEISDILAAASGHKSAWPFLKPVDTTEVEDYLEVVASPTDLETMRKKNALRIFRSAEMFKNEIKLMFDNCRLYNDENSVYTKEAYSLEKFIMPRVDRLVNNQPKSLD
jgi:histone acetyltransferase